MKIVRAFPRLLAFFISSLVFLSSATWADDVAHSPVPNVAKIDNADNAWMLISSALVLLMTAPGLALFYGGLVRTKNVLSTMMQSFFLISLVSILWFIFGYGMAFGEGNAFVGNPLSFLFLKGVGATPNPDYAPTIPQQTFMIQCLCPPNDWMDNDRLLSPRPHGLGQGRLL